MSGSPRYDGALRDIQSPTGLHYRIHETPEDLAVLTPRVAQEPEIWIDTETADWNTKSPRLSLVQLRLGDGSLHVLDGREHHQVGALREVRAADPRRRLRPEPPVHVRARPSRAVPPPPAAEPAAGRARPSSLWHRGRQDLAARRLGAAAAERGAARLRGLGPRMVLSGPPASRSAGALVGPGGGRSGGHPEPLRRDPAFGARREALAR